MSDTFEEKSSCDTDYMSDLNGKFKLEANSAEVHFQGKVFRFGDSYFYGSHSLTLYDLNLVYVPGESGESYAFAIKIAKGSDCVSGDGRWMESITVRINDAPHVCVLGRDDEYQFSNSESLRDTEEDEGKNPYTTSDREHAPYFCYTRAYDPQKNNRLLVDDFVNLVRRIKLGDEKTFTTAAFLELVAKIGAQDSSCSSRDGVALAAKKVAEFISRNEFGSGVVTDDFEALLAKEPARPKFQRLYS
jgi:hypothetical protein